MSKILSLATIFFFKLCSVSYAAVYKYHEEMDDDPETSKLYNDDSMLYMFGVIPIFLVIWFALLEYTSLNNCGTIALIISATIVCIFKRDSIYISIICTIILVIVYKLLKHQECKKRD